MSRIPHILKWSTSIAAAIFLTILVLSLWYHVTIVRRNAWRLEVSGGAIKCSWDTGPATTHPRPISFDADSHNAPFEPWPRTWRRVGWPGFILPLYLPLAAAALPAAFLWYRCRPRPPGQCPRCGYDRRGLRPDSPCPECGATASDPAAPAA